MRRTKLLCILLLVGSLHAEKESFVVKRKRPPSVSSLKEQCEQELGEIIKLMPELHESLALEQKELACIEKESINDLYDLLENGEAITRPALQKRLEKAQSLRKLIIADVEQMRNLHVVQRVK